MPNNTRARSLFDKLATLRATWFDNLHISVGEHEIAQLELISAELEAAINESRQSVSVDDLGARLVHLANRTMDGRDIRFMKLAKELLKEFHILPIAPLIPLDDPEGENFEQVACEREKSLGK